MSMRRRSTAHAIYLRDAPSATMPGARYDGNLDRGLRYGPPSQLDMWTPAARDRYAAYEPRYAWGFANFPKTDGYVATGLGGLWLRGPYLHNGSVCRTPSACETSRSSSIAATIWWMPNSSFPLSAAGTPGERTGLRYRTFRATGMSGRLSSLGFAFGGEGGGCFLSEDTLTSQKDQSRHASWFLTWTAAAIVTLAVVAVGFARLVADRNRIPAAPCRR